LIGVRLTELATPLADGLRGHPDATFTQELFHIPEAQTEAKVQPDRVADDFNRKTMVLIASGWRYGAHTATVSHRRGSKQVVNA
jgi:hypothetical protein